MTGSGLGDAGLEGDYHEIAADRHGLCSVDPLQRYGHGASNRNGQPDTYDCCDLPAWHWCGFDGFPDRHSSWLYRNRIPRRQSGPRRRNGRHLDAERRHAMLDAGDFAVGDVRIPSELRWRWNGGRRRGACYRRDAGHVDIGTVGHVRDGADLGPVGNVRRRFEQRGFLLHSYVNVADRAGWRRTHRDSSGIDRNWQSWGELRSGDTNNERTTHRERRGPHSRRANRADGYIPAPCYDDRHAPLPKHWARIDGDDSALLN